MTLVVWDAGASGSRSHTEGISIASASVAHGEGAGTTASGIASHAEGNATTASAIYSHAEGNATQALGNVSHSEGNSTIASGSYTHAEGYGTTASVVYSHAEGNATTASGSGSHAEGRTTTASGTASHAEGDNTVAQGVYSHAEGKNALAARYGQYAKSSGYFVSPQVGDAQIGNLVEMGTTTSATPVILVADNNSGTIVLSGNTANVFSILNSQTFFFRIEAVARRTDVYGENAGFVVTGVCVKDSTGNARFVGTPVTTSWAETNAATWTLGVSIDTTDVDTHYLKLTATGQAAKTIRWVAGIYITEVHG